MSLLGVIAIFLVGIYFRKRKNLIDDSDIIIESDGDVEYEELNSNMYLGLIKKSRNYYNQRINKQVFVNPNYDPTTHIMNRLLSLSDEN